MAAEMIAQRYVISERQATLQADIEVMRRLILWCGECLTSFDAEVPPMHVSEGLQARDDGVDGIHRTHYDIDIENRFCRHAFHCRAANVLYARSDVRDHRPERLAQTQERL